MEAITEIRIRAFRATEEPETCRRYIQGHRKVLSIYGIENITSNTDDWLYNPSIFVIVVESADGEKLYGGARVQAVDGITPLPLEEATGNMDSRVYEVVSNYARNGVAEASGLWNSREVAGLGIGSLFPSRCAIVLLKQLGISTLLTLSSPATVRFNQWLGLRPLVEVGNKGTFYYPKLDLIATACVMEKATTLEDAHPREREKLLYLRSNLQCTILEKSPFKNLYVNVHYDLAIASADKDEFNIEYDFTDIQNRHIKDVAKH
jgi:hypothetical protein